MVEKVHAAVEARRSPDLIIIARTDARAVEGLDAALERARRYRDAGADVLFVEAPESEAEVAAVAQAFPDTPLLFNAVEGGRTPLLELPRLRELGFRLVLCPVTALLAATAAVQQALADLRRSGKPPDDARCPSRASPTSSGCRRSSASKPVTRPRPDRRPRHRVPWPCGQGGSSSSPRSRRAHARVPTLTTRPRRSARRSGRQAIGVQLRGGAPRSRWRSRHCTSLPLVVAQ